MNGKVLLGMSGGIDSTISAILLQEKGYEIYGLNLKLTNHKNNDLNKLQETAEKLRLKFYQIDLQKEFEDSVIQYFINEYYSGKTPFPCAYCNPKFKWENLEFYRNKFKCDYIATGHYVRKTNYKGKEYIQKGIDLFKDQSFFLWGLSSDLIKKTIFPIGGYNKNIVKKIAKENNLKYLVDKDESKGICFILEKKYHRFLIENSKKYDIKINEGDYIDKEGNIIGKHKGFPFYTIGQRKGLNIESDKPLFVQEIRPKTNQVVLGNYSQLFGRQIFIEKYHFIDINEINPKKDYIVRIRYRNQENSCKIKILNKSQAKIILKEPVSAIAPGQTAVFYENDRVIGGGFIFKN